MRTNLFRTAPVVVADASVVVLIKDIDAVDPWTLVIENMDVAAKLRTKFGSKNANVQFTAIIGAADPYNTQTAEDGNDISITITAGVNQAFSIEVEESGAYTPYGGDVTINLRCDADGRPNQFVSEIIDLLNSNTGFARILRASRPSYSDGSAVMEIPDFSAPTVVMPLTYLSGGASATVTGAAVVEMAAKGYPDYPGPWIVHAASGTALSTISAGAAKQYSFVDVPMAAVRVKVSKGSSDTQIVLTGVAKKKNL